MGASAAITASISALGAIASIATSRRAPRSAYLASKAVASAGFVGTALAVGATQAAWSRLVLVGLAFALVGDLWMGVGGERSFLAGMACFASAYCAYVSAFLLRGPGEPVVTVSALLTAVSIAVGVWFYLSPRLPRRLRPPVAGYFVVMAAMLGLGVASGAAHSSTTIAVGVVLVATSDLAVARERFVRSSFANKAVGLSAYYVGQIMIALSLGAARG